MSMTHHTYAYNDRHLLRDGKPWLPAMGEFHFSRYPDTGWRDSIRLMKAGGVDIVATYVLWIHHEPEQGKFDFTGWRNIRKFLDICAEEDMAVCLRIGPWCHGEVRHGGFPEWLCREYRHLRSNHPDYMERVRSYWTALAAEIKEHIGGSIAIIQYENEYVIPGEECGDNHINALVALAAELGITAPIRTATKCEGHFTGDCLPMFGSYADAPWDGRLTKMPPNSCYIFSHIRDIDKVTRTLSPAEMEESWAAPKGIPFTCAEIGGGVQPTFRRRPALLPDDVGALLNTKLGSGVVLPGIYMYHGGINPGYDLQESEATGGTECPELNYDFQAPIGAYGKISPVYRTLRRTFTFLRDFGEALATMPAVMPADNPQDPDDLEHLRYCWRTNGKSGFLFVGNHVRNYETAAHTRAITVSTADGEITFPEMTFASGDYGIYPFGMPMGNGTLISSNAQPLCKLNGKTYVFFTDRAPVYNTVGDTADAEILTLSEADSLNASKVTVGGKDYLVICKAPYTRDENTLVFTVTEDTPLRIYPDPKGGEGFAEYTLTCPAEALSLRAEPLSSNPLMKEFTLTPGVYPETASDVVLELDYDGSIAELFLDGQKIADQFSLGNGWQISLKRMGYAKSYTLRVFALTDNARVYMDHMPAFKHGYACELNHATATAEYQVGFTF